MVRGYQNKKFGSIELVIQTTDGLLYLDYAGMVIAQPAVPVRNHYKG
jgi:hypothetical protein